jgi:serine/threonine protein kinase
MPIPAPEDFWTLVAASRLVEPDRLATLRREHERAAATLPNATADDAVTTAIATWLVQRGVLSKWQGRRLLSGDSGPFFIGDYRLMERLENDGPGRLFRCRHEPSGQRVCLMVLDRKLCQRADVWAEVVRRTTIAHDAIDPILSRTWALEQVHGNRFIVCEDVDGSSLADELVRLAPLPPSEACQLMLPICAAVAELHRRGAIHGSLSLDALRREPAGADGTAGSGRIRLLQMPLAGDPHAVPAQAPIDATERISRLGRRASFVAPELLLPGRVSDARSDVYSLGCMLHALLTGVAPGWQGDAQRTLSQAAFGTPPPLGPPQVPVEVATLVSYFVARDPANRYSDAAEAADALAGCIGLPAVSGGLPPAQPTTTAGLPAVPDTSSPTLPLPPVLAAGPSATNRAARGSRSRSVWRGLVGLGMAGSLLALVLAIGLSRGTRSSTPSHPSSTDTTDGAAPPDVANRRHVEEKPAAGQTASHPAHDDSTAEMARTATGTEKPAHDQLLPPSVDSPAPVTIVDSATLPWASPTAGRPPSLAYLPAGTQLVLLARPAEIMADEEGRQFVRSLGPRVADGIALLTALCHCGFADIAEMQVGWQAGDGDSDAAATNATIGWTVRFRKPSPLVADANARAKAWGETTEKTVAGETVQVGKALSFWFPDAEAGRVLVMAPTGVLATMIEAAGVSGVEADGGALVASLPQDLTQLVGMLDRSRHLTILGSPHALRHEGGPLLTGPLTGLVEPLSRFFGDDVRAAALSLHCGDTFYAEVDTIAPRAEPATRLAVRLAQQIDTLADAVEDACAAIDPHPYGRKLVMRLPAMIRVLTANTRCGAEGKGVVINAYLPRHAGHNLVLATELALEQLPSAGARPLAVAKTPAAAPVGRAAPLQKNISMVFAKDTLEKSIQMLSEEIGMPIEILGGDLQLDGITKNQSFGLDERDKPAEAVLRAILAKSDSVGRLVYVVRTRNGVESIEITTKAAAAKRGDTLPP